MTLPGDREHAPMAEMRDRLREVYESFLRIARLPILTIAAVNGHAIGAGLNLAFSCDLRLAAPAATFGITFNSSSAVYVRWDAGSERSTIVDRPFPSTVGGTETVFPVEAADGSAVYFTDSCGTDAAEPDSTWAVCRHDAGGRVSAIARGVEAPAGLAMYGDRIVITGKVRGQAGLWTVTPGRFDRVVRGHYGSLTFSTDGKRLVVELEDKGFWSTTRSLRVIDAPL